MKTSKVLEIMINEQECVMRQDTPDCCRDECGCQCCDLLLDTDEVIEAYNEVIKLLKRQLHIADVFADAQEEIKEAINAETQ